MTIYFQCGLQMTGEDEGVTCEWQQVMCWCAQPPYCACRLLMATDSLASQPGRQPSWHYQSHSQTWRCTPAVQPVRFKLMMRLFKAIMSLWRLFVSLVTFPWSLHPCFLNPEDIFILHGKDKKNPLIYGLFTTSRYVSEQRSRSWNEYINTHGAKHPTI